MKGGYWIAQMRKGCAEYSMLVVLAGGEAYGYEIFQYLSKTQTLRLGVSTVYPLLNRLTREGYLAVRVCNSKHGPPRRYYRMTAAGRERLEGMHDYWRDLVKSMSAIKMKFVH